MSSRAIPSKRWKTLSCLCLFLAGPAVAQTMFTEVTDQAFEGRLLIARSTAFGDYDNDGWPDLFLAEDYLLSGKSGIALWHNGADGRFANQTPAAVPVQTPGAKGGGSIFGDYDNDGDLDLFVPVGSFFSEKRGLNALLRNDRGVFRNVTREAALTDILPTDNATWLDYDRDGYLDLYTGNLACGPADPAAINKLYRNQGDGTFADVTGEAGLDLQLMVHTVETIDCAGGSNGGMAAGDFNNDGWPDLYVGVGYDANRLFLNDGQGHFRDATTREIGDEGLAFGVTVGDIDNDGDLEIFQAAGGTAGQDLPFRSLMLLNLGGGQFLDVTEGVGLASLFGHEVLGAGLGDLDNDGDLDLLTAIPHFLFLNQGDGTFVDRTSQSGIAEVAHTVSFADYDLDGFLDVVFAVSGNTDNRATLYRNQGNSNHYLRVELVGVKSNRNGIGARLLSTAGDLKQMREIFGGMGFNQDEMVAHFGLGQQTKVDRLEIRWPSGQVEVLTDIPADQKIRVIEGREGYEAVHPTRATVDTLVAGSATTFKATVWPALFEKSAQVTQVLADLSSLGGPAAAPLVEAGEGAYRLEYPLVVEQNGLKDILITIDQATSLGPYWTQLLRQVTVMPAADLPIFDEVLSPDWQEGHNRAVEIADLAQSGETHTGKVAGFFQVKGSFPGWNLTFRAAAPVEPFGYRLHFAIRPGEMSLPGTPRFTATLLPLPSKEVSLLDSGWVDLNKKAWQVVEIPMEAFERTAPIASIIFTGTFAGTFYLDDLRLVAATPPSVTVVEEDRTTALPQAFALSQNFPNPFNSDTVIRFALPDKGEVELEVFNLAGQQVAALVQGVREAGSYTIRWDGRDERGKELASGIYLYRLRAGTQVETRKLVLVR